MAAALVLLAALVVWLWRWRSTTAAPRLTVVGGTSMAALPWPASSKASTPAVAPLARAAAQPPIIDAIDVDKPALCVGEETMVHVRAHAADGRDEELHYTIGPKAGQHVALRAWIDERGVQLPYEVTVFDRGNLSTSARVPAFTIRHCAVTERVVIAHRLLPNAFGLFEFRASVVGGHDEARGAPFTPVAYHWSSSDGARADGPGMLFTRDLEERPQSSLYTQLNVVVVAEDREGRTLTGHDAVQLMNPAYAAMQRKGVVMLMVRLTPRFPALGEDGVVRQDVELWHQHGSLVTLETLHAVRHYARGNGEAPPEILDAAAVFGQREIAAHDQLRVSLRLDTHLDPDVLAVNYAVQGRSADGYPVRGSFSIMRPPDAPTRENSTPVTDPTLMSKIQRAQAILGRATVSDEDLWRLAHQEKLGGSTPSAREALPVRAQPSSAAARPRQLR